MDRPAGRASIGPRAAALAVLAGVAVVAAWQTELTGRTAAGGLIRTGLVAVAFFAVCGYGPARLLLGEDARRRLWLYALPVGAACGTLALTLLGLLHVPLDVSLALVLVAGAALAFVAVRRVAPAGAPPAAEGGTTAHIAVPLAIAVLLAGIACVPSLRAGFPAVQGQNGDAVLAVGTAAFLQEAPPTDVRPELALDRVPLLWRSKLPIYYGLAAVSRLSGQDPVVAFTGVSAVVIGLAALGFFLFALDGLGAPVLVALGAMAIAGLDRMVMSLAYSPFYNQLWALFALPFALLFGWRFLAEPSRRSATLAGLFVALALFTYPLLLPFPLVFLAVIAWRRRRERGWWKALRLPAAKSAGVRYVLIAALAIPVTAVLVRGIWEKVIPATRALAPGGDLTGWSGMGVLPYLPFGWFFGVSTSAPVLSAVLVGAIFLAALFGLRRVRADGAVALAVLIAGALAGSAYVYARGDGELFFFKALSFTGPLVVMLAVVGLAALRPRGAAVVAVVAFAVIAAESTRDSGSTTFEQTPQFVLELREWDAELPADETIRIDVPASGWQLWSWYMMPRHRVSASEPLGGFFPHPPLGRKADLVLVFKPDDRPSDAIGEPIRENDGFALYRMRDDVPGVDVSSRSLVYDVTEVTL